MMTKDEINIRLRFIKAKIRNIIHYWHYDESLGELRERRQYIHILRDLRKQCLNITSEMTDPTWINELNLLKGVMNIIDPKVKKEECGNTIKNLENYVK